MKKTIVAYEDVRKVYHFGEKESVVLKNLSLEIYEGEYVWITGKSGSGKSTLLNVLTGIDRVDAGRVSVNDQVISAMTEEELACFRGGNIGIIFQFFQLIPTLSIMENILLVMDLVNVIPKENRNTRAEDLLEMVGLKEHKDKLPSMMSGGEQQRVAIARALANDAKLIIADEPTGNLDMKNAQMIYELFRYLNERGKTIIMVTHERELQEGVTRNVVIQDGEILEDKAISADKASTSDRNCMEEGEVLKLASSY
ncbi:MAG: ABC transporter ATP-binding protein [Clostridia bacterium]|nr:ABC transporter ATP-binding protein [Clostridia bacterium]